MPRPRAVVLACVALVTAWLAAPALAQSARAGGTVRDSSGKPIKGATVIATNPDAFPSELTSATDDKGRWAMIGLRSGAWTFVVQAPGFVTAQAPAAVRAGGTPPLVFTLARDPGPAPNALERDIAQQLQAAATQRDQGRLDQALASYQDIRTKNPKLTAVHLVMADVYRRKAAQESDPAAKQALIAQAADAYNEVLKVDASNARARAELASLRGGTP
jgi:hypothetical protein